MRRVGKPAVFTEPQSEGWQPCRLGQGKQQHCVHEVALESLWKRRVGMWDRRALTTGCFCFYDTSGGTWDLVPVR